MNILYVSDENYAPYLGISLLSLLKNNSQEPNIKIFIIEDDINPQNKNKIREICAKFNASLQFLHMEKKIEEINKKISLSDYPPITLSLIFLSTLLPQNIEKIIYIDCDTLINNSLHDLWNLNINEFYCAGVLDTLYDEIKNMTGIPQNYNYINTGFLYINLTKWRDRNIEMECLKIIKEKKDKILLPDQDIINFVLENNILILPPKYNLFSQFLELTYEEIMQNRKLKKFYKKEEIEKAIKNPTVYHFISFIYGRPWIKNIKNPLYYKYSEIVNISPWKENIFEENNSLIKGKIGRFIYIHFPFKIFNMYQQIMDSIILNPKPKDKLLLMYKLLFYK